MVAGWEVTLEESMKGMMPENARSIAGKPLPPIPKKQKLDENGKPPITLVLFYQYIEPPWTAKEHSQALNKINELGRTLGITGRGRCAREGLNCTLTGTAEGIRSFCKGLREWNSAFNETDFKLTDGLTYSQRFRYLTFRKVEQLVGYGLPVEQAPSVKENATQHLEADEYHKMMAEPNTVIIDVRNSYEAEIGRFQPPPGGAEFIDPKVRNSNELPKWLNAPETQDKLQGKKVMMYCTGGIRCERFSALLTQIKQERPEFQTDGEYMVRGGIDRYIKTFPEGGFWKGKNYLFDRRMEQVPEKKASDELEKEIESKCCVCRTPWDQYRGEFKCTGKNCGVPVLVCTDCQKTADPAVLQCPLCEEGVDMWALEAPKLKAVEAQKRKATEQVQARSAKRAKFANRDPSTRLFVGNLPLVMDVPTLKAALGYGVELVHWILDRKTKLWYGSTFVQMRSLSEAKTLVTKAAAGSGIKMGKRRLRINFSPPGESETWPPEEFKQLARPPVPVDPGV